MIIKRLEKSIGWEIKPQTFNEYRNIALKIEALDKNFNTDKQLSTVDSIWVEMPELTLSQSQAGWPPASLPSHVHGWPQACEPLPIDHEKEGDFENYQFDQYNKEPNGFEN